MAAGDVVVVDVGLEDVRDRDVRLRGELEHAVDVALGVDDDRDPPVVGEVAAVTEGGRVDRDDGGHRGSSRRRTVAGGLSGVSGRRADCGQATGVRPLTTGRPEPAHALVPPSTERASNPARAR
jgi:hypothetical protein